MDAFTDPALVEMDLGDVGEVRKLLGAYGASLSDEEVVRIRDLARDFADTTFHWWLRRRARSLADLGLEGDTGRDGDTPPAS